MIDKKQFMSARSEGTSKIHSARNCDYRIWKLCQISDKVESQSNGLSFELQMEKYNILASLISPIQTWPCEYRSLLCLLRIR